MTTPHLIDDLKRDEGYAKALPDGRCQAYPDPLTHAAPWTIGYGHTGLEVHPGMIITREQADANLGADIARAVSLCDRNIPWWRKLDDVRQDVLANMMFNMGWDEPSTIKHEGLSSFTNTLAAFKARDFTSAADHMTSSLWAKEVGDRAGRLIHMTRFGARGSETSEPAAAEVHTVELPQPPPVFTPAPPRPSWLSAVSSFLGGLMRRAA